MDGSFISRCLVQHAPADISPNVLAVLLRKLDSAPRGPLPAPPAADDVSALVAQHGFRMAEAIAKIANCPQVLAKLAKHSSVQVRRVVANSKYMNQGTVEYLWRWACANDDQDAMRSLARCVSFEALLVQRSRLRFVSDSWTHRSGSCFSLEKRLREGPDRTVENLRATISCHDLEEALAAVTLCAAGRFDGMSYKEAVDLFVEQQPRHDNREGTLHNADQPPWLPDQYIALCLRHTLLHSNSSTIDEELAGLVAVHTNRLAGLRPFCTYVEGTSRHQAYRAFRATIGPSPLPVTATPAAARILMGTGSLALTNVFINLANRSELGRLLDADNVFAAFWALCHISPSLDTVLTNQALRLLRQELHDPPQQALDLPADIVIDDDLLAWVVHNSPTSGATDSLGGFVTGCFSQKPRTSMLGELLNGGGYTATVPDLNEVSNRTRRILHQFDRWEDKPWADALIMALGPSMWAPTAPYKYVTDRLFSEFGDNVELWAGCLGLLDSGFPGSLPELLDLVWAMFGDGLTRPDLTSTSCVLDIADTQQLLLFEASTSEQTS